MTPDDIVQTLVEARKHLHACLHALVPLHDRIMEREAGLEHVRRQIQNADIIVSFMEREWARPPALDMSEMALDEKTGFTPLEVLDEAATAKLLGVPEYVPTCPDCGGEGIMHKTWCRR